jgi:hypothetical protein
VKSRGMNCDITVPQNCVPVMIVCVVCNFCVNITEMFGHTVVK